MTLLELVAELMAHPVAGPLLAEVLSPKTSEPSEPLGSDAERAGLSMPLRQTINFLDADSAAQLSQLVDYANSITTS